MSATPTAALGFQNFFQATLTADITASSTDISMDNIPNSSEGFLVIEPDSSSKREVIFYNSKTSLKVVCPSAADGRGQDDTTATSHSTGATVIMSPVAAFYEALQSGAALTPGGITPEKLLSGTGTSWAWQSWTPTWTNLTVGNGTASGAYMQIGKTVFARYSLVLGSTSSVSGAVSFAPPVTAVAYGTRVSIGTGIIDDVGSATYGCFVCFISTTSFAMYVNNSSTSDLLVQMSGTKPIAAYGTGDIVTFSMTYEAA